jgi:hypothetical protein
MSIRDNSDGFHTDHQLGTRLVVLVKHSHPSYLIAEPNTYYWLESRPDHKLDGILVIELVDRTKGFIDEDRSISGPVCVGGVWKIIDPETE